MDETLKKLLEDTLTELKWQSQQHDKMISLLGKRAQPCGQQHPNFDVVSVLNAMKDIAGQEGMKNPIIAEAMAKTEDVFKKAKR